MSGYNSIRETLYTIIKDNTPKRENIDLKGTFTEIGVGSLSFVKIMVEIELQFGVELEDKYYTGDYENIGAFIDIITNYLSGGN